MFGALMGYFLYYWEFMREEDERKDLYVESFSKCRVFSYLLQDKMTTKDSPLIPFTKEDIEEFKKKRNAPSKEKINDCIIELRKWLAQQQHLPKIDEDLLGKFLFGCKYDTEETKIRLGNYYACKARHNKMTTKDSPLIPFTKEDIEEFKKKRNAPSKEKINDCIIELRKWLAQQQHLPKIDEDLLGKFLFGCKYDTEETKIRLGNYYACKARHSDLFSDTNLDSAEHRNQRKFV
ncbi:hypothetical protein M8J76_003451 [Diaphorina citri]|nr:hypothetical protein M8J76_003451 [Diaphorina citri]